MREKVFSVTIQDCDVQTFSVGGNGGSGKDTSNTGVRIVHRASGAVGEGREHRSQLQNKYAAWRRMGESKAFQAWAKAEVMRRRGELSPEQLAEQAVEKDLLSHNLLVETVDPETGEWVH